MRVWTPGDERKKQLVLQMLERLKAGRAEARVTPCTRLFFVHCGLRIALEDGTEADVVAANGVVLGESHKPEMKNENDRSIALFIQYGGSGKSSTATWAPVRGPALSQHELGQRAKPCGGGIFLHPREDMVEKVLLQAPKADCVEAAPVQMLLQTSAGGPKPCSTAGCMSFKGHFVGNFVITTDGKVQYEIAMRRPVLWAYLLLSQSIRNSRLSSFVRACVHRTVLGLGARKRAAGSLRAWRGPWRRPRLW